MNDFSSIGERLKAIRDSRNLNLNDVSELTGISKAMLSKIERGESVPSITTVWKIANGLQITLNDLAGEPEPQYIVKNINELKPLVEDEGLFYLYNMFPFTPMNGIQVFYSVFKPGYHYKPDMFVHRQSSKEYCIVYKGELDVTIGEKTFHLSEGCGIDFDCKEKHGYINQGSEDAIVSFFLI